MMSLSLRLGLLTVVLLTWANTGSSVEAGPACFKRCGCGDTYLGPTYKRNGDCGGEDKCWVRECPYLVTTCGYSTPHNDECELYVSCQSVLQYVGWNECGSGEPIPPG